MSGGLLITFEGLDCCGKGTQIVALTDYLRKLSIKHVTAREPGGTGYGEAARRMVQDPWFLTRLNKGYEGVADAFSADYDLTKEAELFLYLTARSMFIEHKLKPVLAQGAVFIADRFIDSTVAYQGYGNWKADSKALELINTLHRHLLDDIAIHRTYLLDLTVQESLKRKGGGEFGMEKDRIESRAHTYFERVRQGYQAISSDPRVLVIDATLAREEIAAIIQDDIKTLLYQHGVLSHTLVD